MKINTDKDTIQDTALVVGDKMSMVDKRLWFALAAVAIFAIPGYFILKPIFASLFVYTPPPVTQPPNTKVDLQVIDSKVFTVSPNNYTGFVRIRNTNVDWGVALQGYSAIFASNGGTQVAKYDSSTYIPASADKVIVFPRFFSATRPDKINFTLAATKFTQEPGFTFNQNLERVSLKNGPGDMTLSASIRNLTPFIIKQIDLPALIYNSRNEIVAANYFHVNDVLPNESRGFSYSPWPVAVPGAIRAEIIPQINKYDPDIYKTVQTKPNQ